MAMSMTGFGHGERMSEGKKLSCDIRSVNNRYADIQIRLPRNLGHFEMQVRELCRERLSRGKVDVTIVVEDHGDESRRVYCDIPLAEGYKAALEELGAVLERPCLVQVSDLAAYPGVLCCEQAEADDSVWQDLLSEAVAAALDALCDMREQEGLRLGEDILERCVRLDILRERIAARSAVVVEQYREKLKNRMNELLGPDAANWVEPQRLAAELLIFADKAAIDEELVRLSSHFKALKRSVPKSEPIGKKLDFIVQEINREINTIGSKANDLAITNDVVEMKNELEKIREQIQNLE